MAGSWKRVVIRYAVYLYFAVGMALLLSGGSVVSALRYQADKRFPGSLLLFVSVGIFGLLAFSSWDTYQRPISRRKWILLCLLASVGIFELFFASPFVGGGAV